MGGDDKTFQILKFFYINFFICDTANLDFRFPLTIVLIFYTMKKGNRLKQFTFVANGFFLPNLAPRMFPYDSGYIQNFTEFCALKMQEGHKGYIIGFSKKSSHLQR